jgi:hypothetical protein
MRHNVCGTEKIFRAGLGLVIILAGLYYMSWWGVVGLVPLLTAAVGYCPVTHALRFSSCPLDSSPSSP